MSLGLRLRQSRVKAGLSGAQLAVLGATSRSAIAEIEAQKRRISADKFQNLLLKTRSQFVILPTAVTTPAEAAFDIAKLLAAGDERSAYRAVLSLSDGLRSLDPAIRIAVSVEEPVLTGSTLYDAAIAGAVEEALFGLPKPGWLDQPARITPEKELLTDSVIKFYPDDDELAQGFLKHNVLLDVGSLESV
ncbi:helix-turn-helix domain-containing protein [Aurantimicrobium minutum]|uniref:helix-turn-helix domain-containing protein n=1 Tax=Aurantimicrobium minutum TaxID=708131 RepID=UPI002473212B|nr:helix-turn-helix transcriptional regulator [Aurantimicrobium minutum]MDH6422274.1 transcriptional regulator with XRE-family HTH domain [Aurantimicrobium minutum]